MKDFRDHVNQAGRHNPELQDKDLSDIEAWDKLTTGQKVEAGGNFVQSLVWAGLGIIVLWLMLFGD